jgi:hypothetical protein
MFLRLPIALLSAFALVAPAATADARDKNKGKGKDKQEQKSDDRRGGRNDERDDSDRDHRRHDDGGKITICHIPPGNPSARRTLSVGEAAWSAHEGHGDHRGACDRGGSNQGSRRFNALDTNNDGVISPAEWRGDRAAFDRLDRNNDGVLSRTEFSRY